jgi:hypothetical protein
MPEAAHRALIEVLPRTSGLFHVKHSGLVRPFLVKDLRSPASGEPVFHVKHRHRRPLCPAKARPDVRSVARSGGPWDTPPRRRRRTGRDQRAGQVGAGPFLAAPPRKRPVR